MKNRLTTLKNKTARTIFKAANTTTGRLTIATIYTLVALTMLVLTFTASAWYTAIIFAALATWYLTDAYKNLVAALRLEAAHHRQRTLTALSNINSIFTTTIVNELRDIEDERIDRETTRTNG